jgi:hypothetical protein
MFAVLFQIILAAVFLMGLSEARAEEVPQIQVGIHLATWHSKPGFNNINPGVYLREVKSGATIGAYCNSESSSARFPDAERCKLATYAGKTWSYQVNQHVTISATAGFIGGYERGIMPMVLPSALIGNHLRVVIIPAVDPKVRTWAVHAAYEF